MPKKEIEEVAIVFREYGLPEATVDEVVAANHQRSGPLGRFHDAIRAGAGGARSEAGAGHAFTIAISYIVGGLVPLARYFFLKSVHRRCWSRWS